jgi:hypothetical protein
MNADRPALEKEPDRDGRAIGPRNLLVLDVDSLLAPIDLERETLAYQGHRFALAGQSLTTDRASICVQLRMMKMRVRRRSACMIGMAIAVRGGTAQAPTAGRAVIASVAPFRRLVSVVELFVDLAKPQRRHPVLLPVPVVASRSSRRRVG